jgi:hypothetical protein
MKQIGELFNRNIEDTFKSKCKYRNRRDEIISLMTESINKKREGTDVKPTTKRLVALRANRNPFLLSDDELWFEYKECERKGNYSHFFWVTK